MNAKLNSLTTWIFVIVAAFGLISLVGWSLTTLAWAGMNQISVPMAPLTAICFVLIGSSAILLLGGRAEKWGKAGVLIVCTLGLIILLDSLLNYPIGFESALFGSPAMYNNFPLGRMSPVTSFLFVISASALFLNDYGRIARQLAFIATAVALFTSFTFDLGYLYGTPLLYGKNIIPPAWNTSLAFTILFSGILFGFGMNEFPMNVFRGDSVKSRLMRGFLPLTILIIMISGWMDTILSRLFDDHVLITSLVTIASTLVIGLVIVRIARKIGNDIDHIFDFKKQAEKALRESEMHFRNLADSGQALIWTSGLDKKCNYFNQPWLEFTGRTLEQEFGDGWVEGVHPDDLEFCFNIYSSAFERREKFSMDYRLRHNDGTYHWIQDNGTPLYNLDGEFIGYIGHCLDITAQKEAMQVVARNEERFRSTLDSMMEGCQIIGFDWIYIYLNDSADRHNRRPKGELIGKRVTEVWPDYERTAIYACEKTCMEERVSLHREIEFTFPDGSTGWFDVSMQPVPEGIFVLSIDISERKKAEQLLTESEFRYRQISSVSTDYVFSTKVLPDGSLDLDWVAGAFESISGYSIDEFKSRGGWRASLHPDDITIDDRDLERLRNNQDTDSQLRTINRNGEIVWVQVFARPVWDYEHDCLTGIYGAVRNITRQKLAELKIAENEERLRLFVRHSPASIAMFDTEMRYLVYSRRFLVDYEISNPNITGKSHYEVFPEIPEQWKQIHRKCLAGEIAKSDEDPFLRADGRLDWIRWEIHPWYTYNSEIGGIILFSEVITEGKLAKEALRESEAYNRMLFSLLPIGLSVNTLDGRFIDVNEALANTLGRTVDEVKNLSYWDTTPAKYMDAEAEQLKSLEATGRYGPFEKEYIRKDGTLVPVRLQGLYIERNGEKYIWSSIEDISARKNAEQKLRESEEKYRSIYNNSNVAILLTMPDDGRIISANSFACRLFGYTEAEICQLGRAGLIDLNDERIPALLEEREKNGYASGEIRFIRKNGQKFECEVSSVLFADSDGNTLTSLVIRDLTEQKLAETKIQRLNAELEQKVQERTAELEQKNSDLTRMNKLFVGRELRMIELKNVIKELEEKLEQFNRQ